MRNIIKIETVNEVVLKKQNCFVLEHLGLSLFIVAKSVEQRNSWIEAIESLLEEITPHPIRDLVTFQSCPVISNVNGRNEESKDSHIWVKKYASFEESHPLQKNRTIFQRFNLSISISNFPKTPYVQIETDLVMLELDAVVRIFSYLTLRDVANIRCVCKRWRHLTEVTDLWNEVSVNKMKVLCVKSMTDVYGSYVQKLELKSIEGDITSSLFSASLLTHLRLEYTQVNLAVLPKFLVNLTLLKLRYCAIVEGIHGTLKDVTEIKFEKLKYLTFHFNENYDNLQISNLLAMSPGLLKLDLSGTVIINSSVFKDIPFLQELRMEYVKLDGAMLAINCPNLQKLSLTTCILDMSLLDMSLLDMSLLDMSLLDMSLLDMSLLDMSLLDMSLLDMSLLDMSLLDMSLLDMSLLDMSLLDMSLLDMSLLDMSLLDMSLLDMSLLDMSLLDMSLLDMSLLDMSLLDMSLLDMSLLDMSLLDMSLLDMSLLDMSLLDMSLLDMSLLDMSLLDMSLLDMSLLDMSLLDISLLDISLLDMSLLDMSLLDILCHTYLCWTSSVKNHFKCT